MASRSQLSGEERRPDNPEGEKLGIGGMVKKAIRELLSVKGRRYGADYKQEDPHKGKRKKPQQ